MATVPLSTHHADGARKPSQPLSLFMQRELSAIQFERPATVAGGEAPGAPHASLGAATGKSWMGGSAGYAGPKTLASTSYAAKLRRHYELKDLSLIHI